jgi:hypothetical protein
VTARSTTLTLVEHVVHDKRREEGDHADDLQGGVPGDALRVN